MAAQKRIKTEHRNIYYNQDTGKYDVKLNYKVYNEQKKKNDYKAKWRYGFTSLEEARAGLELLQGKKGGGEGKGITLQDSFELWKNKARVQSYSSATITNTEYYMKMLSCFIPLDTPVSDITEEVYENVFAQCREKYKDETIKTLNSTFRKLINLSYKRRLVNENPLARADNVKARKTDKIRIITREEWEKLKGYSGGSEDARWLFLLNVLYYTGIRIGECLALTWEDFEITGSPSGQDGKTVGQEYAEAGDGKGEERLCGMRLNICKTILQDGTPKDTTKNKKNRKIPLCPAVIRLYTDNYSEMDKRTDRIFIYTYNACISRLTMICKKIEIPHCSCHSFRHTFISNLMRKGVPLPVIEKVSGDTQKTIFDRYSHMFEDDEGLVLKALENL